MESPCGRAANTLSRALISPLAAHNCSGYRYSYIAASYSCSQETKKKKQKTLKDGRMLPLCTTMCLCLSVVTSMWQNWQQLLQLLRLITAWSSDRVQAEPSWPPLFVFSPPLWQTRKSSEHVRVSGARTRPVLLFLPLNSWLHLTPKSKMKRRRQQLREAAGSAWKLDDSDNYSVIDTCNINITAS